MGLKFISSLLCDQYKDSWKNYVVNVVTTVGLGVLGPTLYVSVRAFDFRNCHPTPKNGDAVANPYLWWLGFFIAVWALAPPLWFWAEFFFLMAAQRAQREETIRVGGV